MLMVMVMAIMMGIMVMMVMMMVMMVMTLVMMIVINSLFVSESYAAELSREGSNPPALVPMPLGNLRASFPPWQGRREAAFCVPRASLSPEFLAISPRFGGAAREPSPMAGTLFTRSLREAKTGLPVGESV